MLTRSITVTISALLALAIFAASSLADKANSIEGLSTIKASLKKYQDAPAVRFDLKKSVKLALLEDNKKSEGTLTISKGQLRLEIVKPEKSVLIVTPQLIWLITPTPKELGGKTQVLKISSKSFKKQAKAPLGLLLGRPSAWDQFEIVKRQDLSKSTEYTLKPKAQDVVGEIVGLKVELEKQSNELKSLTYSDDLENETHFDFSDADYKAKVKGDSFKYIPTADAEITEYK